MIHAFLMVFLPVLFIFSMLSKRVLKIPKKYPYKGILVLLNVDDWSTGWILDIERQTKYTI